jgi:hypothetical protein
MRIEPIRLAVRTELPELTRRQLARLPESLRIAHEDWLGGRATDVVLRRAAAAARGLAQDGDSFDAIGRQLRSWGFPASVAYDAARDAIVADRDIELR